MIDFTGLIVIVFVVAVKIFYNFIIYVDTTLNVLIKNQQRLQLEMIENDRQLRLTILELSKTLASLQNEMRTKGNQFQCAQLELAKHVLDVNSKVNAMDRGNQQLRRRLEDCQNQLERIPSKQIINNGQMIICNEYKPVSFDFSFALFGFGRALRN